MTPELQKIGNKLFLGTQKVELASVKELQKSISDINSGIGAVEKIGNQLASELSKAQQTKNSLGDSVKSILSLGEFVKSQINDFNAKAKDLGVDVSNVKEVKELEQLQKTIKEYQSFFNGIAKIPEL